MNTRHTYHWFTTGTAYYAALLEAIGRATESIRLEMYIYTTGFPGDPIRDALEAAARRGVRVKVLLDAFGSYDLPAGYWTAAHAAGVQVRLFNPLALKRIAFRNHRKLLVCDNRLAFVSGFNISSLEKGDGIHHGWRDLGLALSGPAAREMAGSFDRMYTLSDFRHRRLRLRLPVPPVLCPPPQAALPSPLVLTSGPDQNGHMLKRTLLHDLKRARSIRIISAYFLPTYRIRRILAKASRRGREVWIITAGKTDVQMARYAGRALYQRLLRRGIRIFEYEAQILHSKLIIADDIVYVGSANLDTRSLTINYELLVRIKDPQLAHDALQIFQNHLAHSGEIKRRTWRRSRGWIEKLVERFSHFILARIDPLFAQRQMTKLR